MWRCVVNCHSHFCHHHIKNNHCDNINKAYWQSLANTPRWWHTMVAIHLPRWWHQGGDILIFIYLQFWPVSYRRHWCQQFIITSPHVSANFVVNHVPLQGVVRLNIVAGRDLKCADVKLIGKGKSDPYCKLLGNQPHFSLLSCLSK